MTNGSRIVVGVDGSEPSTRALRWGLAEAQRVGDVVEAVHAYDIPVYPGMSIARVVMTARGHARGLLSRVVDPVAADFPGVAVRCTVRRGPAGDALVRSARGARLLAVGSRGHGLVSGLLLGSVAEHCASYAPCPVVVLPPAVTKAAVPDGPAAAAGLPEQLPPDDPVPAAGRDGR